VGPDQHLTELDEITVCFIVNFDDSPGVGSSSDLSAIRGRHNGIGTDHCEWHLALLVSYAGTGDSELTMISSFSWIVSSSSFSYAGGSKIRIP
jgi:hypothetical protein